MSDAVLYDSPGACFAAFHRGANTGCPRRPPDGIRRDAQRLELARPVLTSGDRIGTLVLSATLPSIVSVLRQYLGSAALIFFLSLVVAAVVATALQAGVSAPVLAIARVAQRIAETHRFQDRVTVSSSDELGVLANSFNAMLEEIARRDAELAQQRRWLEEQVTERNRVNAELLLAKEKAEDAALLKSQFLANMSHEIRTPMNGVVGMISLVLEKCRDDEDREQLRVAQSAAQSLVALLNDILDLSKMEAGKMTVEAIDFNLRSVVDEALRMFDISVSSKGLHLSFTCAPQCPSWVRGDPVRLRQVLTNLVGNAVKFTTKGGVKVDLSTARPGVVRVAVLDTGIGIPAGKLESIFEAFTQADGSHTRQYGGTGLGLTITRRLVDLMGGQLHVESEPGMGSRFYFELPLPGRQAPRTQPSVGQTEKPEPAPSEPLPNLHVLIAEDNPINQKVIEAMLRRQGWTVVLCANGTEACDHFFQEQFSLVLMDVQMPEMDGLEATRRIRRFEQQSARVRTPIVALTAHAHPAQQTQCLDAGMDAVITKPVSVPALLRGIASAIPRTAEPVRS